MNKKITISVFVFIVIATIFITGYIQKEEQHLVEGEPIKYTFDEVNQKVRILTGPAIEGKLSEDVKEICLEKVFEYIYTFPGYKYESISGIARTGNVYNNDANVYISIDAKGLTSGEIATENGKQYGDSHTFELKYSENTRECELLSYHFFNWVIPKVVLDTSVLLAEKHPVVEKFIDDSETYDLDFEGWIDDYKGKGTNYKRLIDNGNFKKPIRGIVILSFRNSRYYNLFVYVDVFNGEVFTEGPIFNPPR